MLGPYAKSEKMGGTTLIGHDSAELLAVWPMKPIGSAPAVSIWISVIVVVIGAHSHKKHRASSAWSVDITLSSILLTVQCEIHIAGMLVGYIHSVSHALETKWRH